MSSRVRLRGVVLIMVGSFKIVSFGAYPRQKETRSPEAYPHFFMEKMEKYRLVHAEGAFEVKAADLGSP